MESLWRFTEIKQVSACSIQVCRGISADPGINSVHEALCHVWWYLQFHQFLSCDRYDVINCVNGMVGFLVLILTEAYADNSEGKNPNLFWTQFT